ncbi:MAG: trigger factor [Gemmatimonadota bacterium]
MTDKSDTAETGLDIALQTRDGPTRRLTISIPPDRVVKSWTAERDRISRNIKLKGFRKGKVPAAVVEQRFGHLVDERALQALVNEGFRAALSQEDLQPIGDPVIGNVKYARGERLTFEIELEVVPEIRLDRVGGFRIERPATAVTEDEVDAILAQIQKENSDWDTCDRAGGEGDRVSLRIAPLPGGADDSPGESRTYTVVLGDGQALPEVEAAIRTLDPGQEGAFEIDFGPDAEPAEETAELAEPAEETADAPGRKRWLHIAVDGVESPVLKDLDDELAAAVGDFETLDDLKAAVRSDLQSHHAREAEQKVREQLVEALIDANPFEPPRSMVERYLTAVLQAPEDADPEELEKTRAALLPHAEREVRRQLLFERLIEREGFAATGDEISQRVTELADSQGVKEGEMRSRLARSGSLEDMGRHLAVEKVFGYLKSESGIE